jgi:hypothetical protein
VVRGPIDGMVSPINNFADLNSSQQGKEPLKHILKENNL